MLKNYFKIAWRNIWRQKLYSCINIGGLAAGLAACMLILSYIAHENSYDRFHQQADQIYSSYVRVKFGADTVQMPSLSIMTAPLTKTSSRAVKSYVRFSPERRHIPLQNANRPAVKFSQDHILYADSNFFTFFTFPLIKGNPATALRGPGKVVLSETAARRYFGKTNPLGKTIIYDGKYRLEVAGVAQNAPSNSSIKFELVISLATIKTWEEKAVLFASAKVGSGDFTTYFMLNKHADARSVERIMGKLADRSGPPGGRFLLTALPSVHFDANFGDTSHIRYLKIFGGVALLILLLALVNYMSLATAKATFRAKEVGVRKVLGAARARLAGQFYAESTLFVLIAFIFGLVLFIILRPYFYQMLQIEIDRSFLFSSFSLLFLTGLLIVAVLGAGAYPSLFLSSFSPAALSGNFSGKGAGASVRKVFIVLQFVIAVGLICGGIVIRQQLSYFHNVDTGVNRNNVLMIPFDASLGQHYPAFRKELSALASVQEVAAARYSLYSGYDMFKVNSKDKTGALTLKTMNMDRNLLDLLGVRWKFPPANTAAGVSSDQFFINEAAARKLGILSNPVGETIQFGGIYQQVAGVVEDFNFESLHSDIDALALFPTPDTSAIWGLMGGNLFLRITPGANLTSLISAINHLYTSYGEAHTFEYYFLDDKFNALYKAEDRLAQLFGFFIGLAILIACSGLFGLAAFTIEQRTKEIGIRRVLGAPVHGVISLLSRDFIRLVLAAIAIAIPLAWYAMNRWLQDFAYRIELEWWMFALAGSLAVVVALLTVSVQSLKAALMDPVKALKSD